MLEINLKAYKIFRKLNRFSEKIPKNIWILNVGFNFNIENIIKNCQID